MIVKSEHDTENYGIDAVSISFGIFIAIVGTLGLAILMGAF